MNVLAERVEELRGDTLHGASWMARRAVETLLEVADEEAESSEELLERLLTAARELADSRPGVGAIAGAVGRLVASVHRSAHLPPSELRRVAHMEAEGLIAGRDRAKASIAIQLRERLTDALVVTHSASATVREALVHTPPELVVCTITQPHGEGRRFAAELREAGLNVELVDDDDAPSALEHSTLLLVGADMVFRDGAICNKIGTRRLAEAADELGVWTVAAAEVLKLAPVDLADAPELTGEAAELFDFTPAHLIDAIVTDEGTVAGEGVGPLVDRTPFLGPGYELLRGG